MGKGRKSYVGMYIGSIYRGYGGQGIDALSCLYQV